MSTLEPPRRVNLFLPCLADQLHPEVGIACVTLLERLGIEVAFPADQTCCGQPAFNDGFHAEALPLAERMLDVFGPDTPVVVPSGSCAAMLRKFYGHLLPAGGAARAKWQRLAPAVFELSEFLVHRLGVTDVGASWTGRAVYHDGCHQRRELGITSEPRDLLRNVRGLDLVEIDDAAECCGFGGLFAVKFAALSEAILASKLAAIARSGADTLVSGDTGCLLQIGGGLARAGAGVRVVHLAEVLASTA
jgi:L-lactate dehydrogenase complex protein LldE